MTVADNIGFGLKMRKVMTGPRRPDGSSKPPVDYLIG